MVGSWYVAGLGTLVAFLTVGPRLILVFLSSQSIGGGVLPSSSELLGSWIKAILLSFGSESLSSARSWFSRRSR